MLRSDFRFCFIVLIAITGCSRKPTISTSTLSISAPSSKHVRDAIPSGRKACFGINVTGSGIPMTNGTCSPPTGIVGGYIEAGQDVQLTVPSNLTIGVDLYLFLLPAGQTGACPNMLPNFPAAQLADTYLIGSATNVSTAASQVTVNITANFPASNMNITQQLAMPATCQIDSTAVQPASPFSVSAGGTQSLSNGSYKMIGHAGSSYQRPVLSNSQYKLMVR